MLDNTAWTGAEVAITGASGVLGRRLVRRLCALGARRVVAVGRTVEASMPDAGSDTLVERIAADILDRELLERAVRRCTIVFHLAALTDASRSSVDPAAYWETNLWGTVQVMEACRRAAVRQVVYASTCHVYGLPRYEPIDEDHPTKPLSVYAAGKLAAEAVVQGYATGLGVGGTVLRMTNLYGGELGANTVIGLGIAQAAAGGPIRLRSLTPVRDFLHVDDAIEALAHAGLLPPEPRTCRVLNASTGSGVSIGEMARVLAHVAARRGLGEIQVEPPAAARPDSVPSMIVGSQRLRALTGWKPEIDLEHGLDLALTEHGPVEKGR